MGVKDLWKLLEPAGRPVTIESLNGKVLAVDVSIWLNQALKGARDQSGAALPNSHLLVLFHRLCKLLYYNIKPVIVFDGAIAELKQQTLMLRRKRRHIAQTKSDQASTKLVLNYAKSKALEEITGAASSSSSKSGSIKIVRKSQTDLYQLPPLPDEVVKEIEHQERQEEELASNKSDLYQHYFEDLDQMDFNGVQFTALPAEIQHELITARKRFDKNRSSIQSETLPVGANDFSSYQLSRLVQRSRLSKRLDDVRKSLNLAESSAVMVLDPSLCEVEVNRIASDETARYILIKNPTCQTSSISMDEIVTAAADDDFTHCDNKLDSDNERINATGSEADTSDITVEDISSNKNTSSDRVVNVNSDKIATNSVTHARGNVVIIDVTSSNEGKTSSKPYSGDDKATDKVDITHSTAKYKTDVNDKVSINDNEVVGVTSDKVDIIDLDVQHDDTTVSKVSVTDNKNDRFNIKNISNVDTKSDTVGMTDGKEGDVVSGELKSDKEDITMAVVSDSTAGHDFRVSSPTIKTPPCSPLRIDGKGRSNRKQPLELDMVAMTPPHLCDANSTTEVDVMSSDSDSESEDLMPLAKRVRSEKNPTRHDLLESVQQELVLASPIELQSVWGLERIQLQSEQARQSRLATTVSNQMYEEAQELLSLFGVPYIVSPCEAEAQCAHLDYTGQVFGTVTDDSDYFLFGGKQVYRSFFSTDKDISCYKDETIEQILGLDRLQLINLAYLLGSDYTVGMMGVGVVTAMEVLKDFPGCGLEVLEKFKIWHQNATLISCSHRSKLRNVSLDPNFPDERIQQAYLHPSVDDSQEEFTWNMPDLDLLRQYAREKFGWDKKRSDQELLPVIQKINQRREKQRKIEDFMLPQLGNGNPPIRSNRLLKAVSSIRQRHGSLEGQAGSKETPQTRTELSLSSESSDED